MLVDATQSRADRNADAVQAVNGKAVFRALVQTVLNDEQEYCWIALPWSNRGEQILLQGAFRRTCMCETEMPQSDLTFPGRES